MKKFLLLFLALVAMTTLSWAYDFSAVAPSGQTLYYNIVDGNAQVTYQNNNFHNPNYQNLTGSLTIPSSVTYNGTTYSVTSIGEWAFFECRGLIGTLAIPNSVTSIGYSAFCGCSGLTGTFTIPTSVTSIGEGAFDGCSGLTFITIPNSVTSIGYGTFWGCSGLTSVSIPTSVSAIGDYAFYNCSSLTSVSIPTSATAIGDYAFYGCSSLTFVTIPTSVTSIGTCAFNGVRYIEYEGIASGAPWCAHSMNVIVDGDFVFSSEVKDTLLAYIGNGGTVIIPNSVTHIDDSAFFGCITITSVTIPSSVTSIGSYAFSGCSGLNSVTIPTSVTSIGECAFNGIRYIEYEGIASGAPWCAAHMNVFIEGDFIFSSEVRDTLLAYIGGGGDVIIPNSVTHIDDSAFFGCIAITSVTIPSSVTSIGNYAFAGCGGINSVTIPSSVTSIGACAFNGITYIEYEGGATGAPWCATYMNVVIDGDFIFSSEAKDTLLAYIGNGGNVTIPNSVTCIGESSFAGCRGLTSVTIPTSVTSIGNNAFNGCTALSTVNYNASNCTSMATSCFDGCTFLETLTIGEDVSTIPSTAFENCTGLTTLNFNATNCTSASFSSCAALAILNIGENVTNIPDNAFNNCVGLTSVTIGTSVESIGTDAFYACTGITTLNFNATNCTNASFSNCTALATLNIGDNVINIPDNAFSGLAGLTSVTIGTSVTSIGTRAFSGCTGLTSVNIPSSVTSIGDAAFRNCSGLTSVDLPNSVTTVGDEAFYGCSSLTEPVYNNRLFVYYPCGLSDTYVIPDGISVICGSAFWNCSSIASVTIPSTVTTIEKWAFGSCSGLTGTLAIPNSVTTIGTSAFEDCSGLTSLTIGNSVTTIETSTFAYCSGLTSVTIGNSVTTIGEDAFQSCSNLSSLILGEALDSIGDGAFRYCSNLASIRSLAVMPPAITVSGYFASFNNVSASTPVYVPCASVDSYASSWTCFSNIIGECTKIACVSVDQNNHNVVRWEPYDGSAAVSYNIYRDGLGGFSLVANVPYNSSLSDYSWVDEEYNTSTQACTYKISEVFGDGTESALSAPHTTMHLQISQGQGSTWNLAWTPYIGFQYDGYRIYRGTSADDMSLMATIGATNTSYSDAQGSSTTLYQVEVVPSSSAKSITVASRSNIAAAAPATPEQYTITVVSHNPEMGTVTGGGLFDGGATTTITAEPFEGYRFVQWHDGNMDAIRTITVTADATYTAYFESEQGGEPQQYVITVVSIDENMGTVTGGGLFDEGTITTIMATAKPGYQFVQWQDGNTQDIRTITVTADATYTAYFRADGTQGIDDVSAEDVKVFARGMEIVVEGCEGDEALVYDVTGRVMHRGRVEGPIRVGAMGVYMVKVGERQPRKVVVR